ncbi:MAG: C2H2-type zinc finger protein [Desulfobulbaceae bacterium]|nr:C2H2-type zinc finger protein [Desulfobulbaceae bacterium]
MQTGAEFQSHVQDHHDERPFECRFCSMKFAFKSSHTKHGRYRCPKNPALMVWDLWTDSFQFGLRADSSLACSGRSLEIPGSGKAEVVVSKVQKEVQYKNRLVILEKSRIISAGMGSVGSECKIELEYLDKTVSVSPESAEPLVDSGWEELMDSLETPVDSGVNLSSSGQLVTAETNELTCDFSLFPNEPLGESFM